MVAFIDQHQARSRADLRGVADGSVHTCFLRNAKHPDPTTRSPHAHRDNQLPAAIQRVWDDLVDAAVSRGTFPMPSSD